jgi:hypothetical protein
MAVGARDFAPVTSGHWPRATAGRDDDHLVGEALDGGPGLGDAQRCLVVHSIALSC